MKQEFTQEDTSDVIPEATEDSTDRLQINDEASALSYEEEIDQEDDTKAGK